MSEEPAVINVPNLVTVGRVVLSLVTIALLWIDKESVRWLCFILTALVIWGDGLDGYLARKLKQASKFGAVLDIASDRTVELAYWIAFAVLNWIPVWVPLLFLVRGTFVDAIRAQASEQGYSAFGEKTMMQSGLGKFLVASNFMRFTYAIIKAVSFCMVIAANTGHVAQPSLLYWALTCVYLSAGFCVVRGLPVLWEGRRLLAGRD